MVPINEYDSKMLVITPSDFGKLVPRDLVDIMAQLAIVPDKSVFACNLVYTSTNQPPSSTFSYDASLAYAMMVLQPLNTEIPIDTTPCTGGLQETHERVFAETKSTDQCWQMVSTRQTNTRLYQSSVPDPAYEMFEVTLNAETKIQYRRNGYYRIVPHIVRREVSPSSFTFGGAMLFEQTGVGKTRVVVRLMSLLRGQEEKYQADRLDAQRVFLPYTSIVVVPPHVVDSWVTNIKEVWPSCQLRVVRTTSDLEYEHTSDAKRVRAPLREQLLHGNMLDVVLVSRDLFVTLRPNTMFQPKPDTVSFQSVLSMFREVQFQLAVLDEAHLYVNNVPDTITPQAVVVRTHAYAYTTLLVTATPVADRGSVLQYAHLVGVSHTRGGQLSYKPLSQCDRQERQFLYSEAIHPTNLLSPSLLQVHGSRWTYRWMVDSALVDCLTHAFTHHCVTHTNACVELPVRNVTLQYTRHPFEQQLGRYRMRVLIQHSDVAAQHAAHLEMTYQILPVEERMRLQRVLDELYTKTDAQSVLDRVGTITVVGTEHRIPLDIVTLVTAANKQLNFKLPTYELTDLVWFRLIVTLCEQEAKVLLCIKNASQVKKYLALYTPIRALELKGTVYAMENIMRQFHTNPSANILILHPNHIDGTNIPEITHVLVDNVRSDQFQQIVGRATRFGRQTALSVITIRPEKPPASE